jgi:exonuclease III
MKGAFWNIRGLNKTIRVKTVSDLIKMYSLDFLGIQESKKENFSDAFLNAMDKIFCWKYVPANGSGILMGFKSFVYDIVSWQEFQYCGVTKIKNQTDNSLWRVITVYGSPYEETKIDFITELHKVCGDCLGPTLIGGDLNLVRCQEEKSNGNVNFNHVDMFNDWIDG